MLKESKFVAFYSHKGGVGRSLALANVAYILAYSGKKVLIIDLDLEAPGQHATDLFADEFTQLTGQKLGLIDLLENYKAFRDQIRTKNEIPENTQLYEWHIERYLIRSNVFEAKQGFSDRTKLKRSRNEDDGKISTYGSVWLLPATGKSGDKFFEYQAQLADWNWDRFYHYDAGVVFFDALKFQLRRFDFDYVLIDCRTGFNDIFYTSTLLLADTVVCLFGLNRQNVEGTAQAVYTLTKGKTVAAYGKKRIVLVGSPIPPLREREIRARLAEVLSSNSVFRNEIFDLTIPYEPYLALREELLSMDAENPLVSANHYTSSMVALTRIIEESIETDEVVDFTPPDRINPFPAIRVEYWHESEVVNHFVDPGNNIKDALQQFMPTVVLGSRGTGKTMLARWFDYETNAYRLEKGGLKPSSENTKQIGLWFRLDIDLLNAFNCDEDGPRKFFDLLFGQFLDLLFLRKALKALERLGGLKAWLDVTYLCRLIEREMNVGQLNDFEDLEGGIGLRLSEIRAYINNPSEAPKPFIVQSNILLKTLVETLRKNGPFLDGQHYFSIFIDEYENFHVYQQRIVNTRLKQARESDRVTFKLLARNDGIHTYETLAKGQSLETTHDFRRYYLDEGISFSEFHRHVQKIVSKHLEGSEYFRLRGFTDPENLFKQLTVEDEVAHLTTRKRGSFPLEKWIDENHPEHIKRPLKQWMTSENSLLRKAVVVVLINQGKDVEKVIEEFRKDSSVSRNWYHNYHVGALYWLHSVYKKEKRYAGFRHIVGIAGNNTRVALDLCYAVVETWLASGEQRALPIGTEIQSSAIHNQSDVYFRKLVEKGQDAGQIHRFVQRLGRFFEVIHKGPLQSEPEINHFKLKGEIDSETRALMRRCRTDAVLRWLPANKQKNLSDDQRDSWQLHPRYAPHFGISWRRKKGIEFTASQIRLLFLGADKDWKKFVRSQGRKYRSIRQHIGQDELL